MALEFPSLCAEQIQSFGDFGIVLGAWLIRKGKLHAVRATGIHQPEEPDEEVPAWSAA